MKLNHAQGQAGEDCALAFLQKQGCEPVARNWHCRAGEIDLVVRQGELLLFVEVRYRKNKRFGGAAYSITPAKLQKLQRTAEHYLQQHPHGGACRIDAVLIEGSEPPKWIQNLTG